MKNNNSFKYIFYILLLIVTLVITIFSFSYFLNNKVSLKIAYQDEPSLNYKVFLKENNFFEQPYIDSGKTYISSLIDYIDINYNYKMDYSSKLSGNYKYKAVAILEANKANEQGKNYWTKEYLLNEKESNIEDNKTFVLNDNLKINYKDYIDILNNFKSTAGISFDGTLKIKVTVSSDMVDENYENKHVKNESTSTLIIPLTEASMNIEMPSESSGNNGIVKLGSKTNITVLHIAALIISIISLITFAILLIKLIETITTRNKYKSEYEIKLEKILTTYNSIIVNVDTIRDLSKFDIITVNSFDELLDAHSEVRMPINFVKSKDKEESVFVLINEDIAWVYRLK